MQRKFLFAHVHRRVNELAALVQIGKVVKRHLAVLEKILASFAIRVAHRARESLFDIEKRPCAQRLDANRAKLVVVHRLLDVLWIEVGAVAGQRTRAQVLVARIAVLVVRGAHVRLFASLGLRLFLLRLLFRRRRTLLLLRFVRRLGQFGGLVVLARRDRVGGRLGFKRRVRFFAAAACVVWAKLAAAVRGARSVVCAGRTRADYFVVRGLFGWFLRSILKLAQAKVAR